MNQFRTYFTQAPAAIQLLLLFALSLMGAAIFSYMALVAIHLMHGLGIEQLQEMIAQPIHAQQASVFKIFQVFTSVGIFLVPAMIFSQLMSERPDAYLHLNKKIKWLVLLAVILLFVAISPVTDALMWLNAEVRLPAFLSSFEADMRSASERSQALMQTLVQMNNFTDFGINLLVMAALPAIAEEFFFRGVMQKIIQDRTNKIHLSVWVTALAFALMHQQFYAMLPLVALGALLGYLKVWTGSLWASIAAHFVNNALIVVVLYFTDVNMSDMSDIAVPDLMWLLPSALVCFGLGRYLFVKRTKGF